MRILLLCDDFWHPGQVPTDGVKPLESKGFEFDIVTDAGEIKADLLSKYPVVMLSKSGQITKEDRDGWKTPQVQQAFIDYVENGGGLLVMHNATVPGNNSGAMDKLVGSRFTFHPAPTEVMVKPVKPHPVTEGVDAFCELDEHYRLDIVSDDIDILIASYSPSQGEEEKYKDEPSKNSPAWIDVAGYVRTQGKGRVCVLLPGHFIEVWHNPQFQRTLENALNWCAG